MIGKWLVVLPLLVGFNKVYLQPIVQDRSAPRTSVQTSSDCCPCPGSTETAPAVDARANNDITPSDCPSRLHADDAEGAASLLLPAFRDIQPFVRQSNEKTESKPLLQPEMGLASSVLETLRQVTEEEYQDALARNAARSAVKLAESSLDNTDNVLKETPNKKVTIFLNTKGDEMEDNIPEPSHIQETRCVHSPLGRIHPTTMSTKQLNTLRTESILNRNLFDIDNGIGASSIQTQVILPELHHNLESVRLKSNPNHVNLFGPNKEEEVENNLHFTSYDLDKNIDEESNLRRQPTKPKLHLKLRQLLDNLEITSNKEKPKVPVTEVKKYIPTITQIPPIKFRTIENPLFLKNFLKMKDVELIPRKTLTNNAIPEKSLNSNLILQPENSIAKKTNTNCDNCEGHDNNLASLIDKNNEIKNIKNNPEIRDTEINPSNVNYVVKAINHENNRNMKQKFIPVQSLTSSQNINLSSIQLNVEDQDNFDYSDIKIEEDSNTEQLLSKNCNETTEHALVQQAYSSKHQKYRPVQKPNSNEDSFSEKSNNEGYQIDLIESFDTPFQFENSSSMTLNINNENAKMLPDAVAATSKNHFQIANQNIKSHNMSEIDLNYILTDTNLQGSVTTKSDHISEDYIGMDGSKEINLIEQESSEGDINLFMNNADDNYFEENEEPNHVSFKDLEDMSNSILNLSECKVSGEENINKINEIFDGSIDTPNTEFPAARLHTNLKETETDNENLPDIEVSLNTNKKINEDINSDKNICEPSISDKASVGINRVDTDSSVGNREMHAEASELQTKSIIKPKFTSNDVTIPESNNFGDINHNPKTNKQLNFLNNIKSKMAGLFSTTDPSEVCNSPTDNINESSNMNTMTDKLDKLQNVNKLQRPPLLLPREILSSKLPVMPLIKFAEPNNINEPVMSNSHNFLNFPLGVSPPFEEPLEPNLILNALSNRLRSHTEDTIQNVKETLQTTFKDSQSFRMSNPTDTHDLIQGISTRRDEMKAKLDAIHSDFNDRFSSFQQNILDHINQSPGGNFDTHQKSKKDKLKMSNMPSKKELPAPEVSNLEKIKNNHDFLLHRVNVPKSGKNKETSLKTSKVPVVTEPVRFRNIDKTKSVGKSVLYPISTEIPSSMERSKVLTGNTHSIPRLTSNTLAKERLSKISKLSEEHVTKIKPLSSKPGWISKLTEKSHSSLRSQPRINRPVQSLSTNTDDSSIDSPLYQFRKRLKNQNENSKNKNPNNSHLSRSASNLLNDNHSSSIPGPISSLVKKGRPRNGLIKDDELIVSPTSYVSKVYPSQPEDGLRIVEPLKENVPYKCKLICYKDS